MTLSLYIHIPFCLRRCSYCDFASEADSVVSHEEYIDAIIREMSLYSLVLAETPHAHTLYIGGGTPSLLAPPLVERIITAARKDYNLVADAEVTLEVNPGTVTSESLAGYRSAGVNRLSIGVQSLDDSMLAILGRIHSGQQSKDAMVMARNAGFDNISIDLIHSLPGQTIEHWRQTLAEAVALGPDHISCYGLTIEEGTPFSGMLERDEISLPTDDESAAMYEEAMSFLSSYRFEQYEIANFAALDKRSSHNQVYWRRGNYLGFGAGAHSFLRKPGFGRRWYNPPGVTSYCRSSHLTLQSETDEKLTRDDAMGEFLFLGLRLLEGVDPELLLAEFGVSIEEVFPGVIERQIANGLLLKKNGRILLSKRGILLANQVFADFA